MTSGFGTPPQGAPQEETVRAEPVMPVAPLGVFYLGATRPTPETPQYGVSTAVARKNVTHRHAEMPLREIQHACWGQAQLQSAADAEDAAPPFDHHWRWYLIELDGWVLNFWAEGDHARGAHHAVGVADGHHFSARPVRWVDLRSCRDVRCGYANGLYHHSTIRDLVDIKDGYMPSNLKGTSRFGHCPYEVKLIFASGGYGFRVKHPDQAEAWESAIRNVITQKVAMDEYRRKSSMGQMGYNVKAEPFLMEAQRMMQGLSPDEPLRPPKAPWQRFQSMSGGYGDEDETRIEPVDPGRAKKLTKLWWQCVKDAAAVSATEDSVYSDLFDLYDGSQEGNLTIDEVAVLVRELAAVRQNQLVWTLQQEGHHYDALHFDGSVVSDNELQLMEKVKGLAEELTAIYQENLSDNSLNMKAIAVHEVLDLTHDNSVNAREFVHGAPMVVIQAKTLQMEAQFYKLKNKLMQHKQDDEANGCVDQ